MSRGPCGVLILHGFTDTTDAVSRIEPPLSALGLPTRMPILRGHGARSPEALRGVTWHDWVADGETALEDLLAEVDTAIVIGYSMGGLVAITLAAEHPDTIDSIVLAAAVVQIESPMAPRRPLHFLAPLIVRLLRKWDMPPVYVDAELARHHNSYPWAPTDAIASLLEFSEATRDRLPQVSTPTLILQSRNDSTAAPECAEIIYNGIATPADNKKVVWFERTEHEMFRDCERDAIVAVITDYVRERIGREAVPKAV
jgi:carboxylesterase